MQKNNELAHLKAEYGRIFLSKDKSWENHQKRFRLFEIVMSQISSLWFGLGGKQTYQE